MRVQLSVIFTDACNLRCSYCTTAKRPVSISSALLERLVQVLDRSAPAALDLNFHGGEPTLAWERVEELVERILPQREKRKLSLSICTNGTRLDTQRARFLAAHGFNARVSIDGLRETHTRFRRPYLAEEPYLAKEDVNQSYDQTLSGLRALVEAGVSSAANMVVTPATVGELTENAAFLLRQGLVHLVISPVVGQPWEDAALLKLDQQLREMTLFWERWLSLHPRSAEHLRRSLLSEISRARYCSGDGPVQPDARFWVIGPDGRIFGDEPDARTERALTLGHLDQIEDLSELPALPRNAFELMYDRAFYPEHVLRDVRRTHRLLAKRTRSTYERLFGPLEPQGPTA